MSGCKHMNDGAPEEEHEVVVVGAGPAGSMTALSAADRGLDVLLIDRNPEIGVPVRCAEGVSQEIEKYIKIDSRCICSRIKGFITNGPEGTRLVVSASDDLAGYVLDRRVFDKALAHEAARAGAEVRVKSRACGILKSDGGGRVRGVYVNAGGEELRILADVVVAADGVESRVARWAGIDTRLRLEDIATCAQYLMCDIDVERDYCEQYFGWEIAPAGYAWVFPKGEHCANVGIGIGGNLSTDNHRAIDFLNAFVRDKFPDGKIIAEMFGAVPLSGPVYRTVTSGLLLVGDAARHVNPFSGGGIQEAIQGGQIAGEVIARAVREKDCTARRLREYERRWWKEFGRTLYAGLKVKNYMLGLPQPEFNRLFRSLNGELKLSEYTERALMKEIAKKNPKMMLSMLIRTLKG